MSEVKWIKIVTDIFDDEKIKYIETMPNGDTTIVLWFRILCLAGRSNRDGLLMMTDRIHYTDEMLAAIFNRDIKTIQLALSVFENLGMIEIVQDKAIAIANWEKHQNTDRLEQMREKNRLRVANHRQKKIGNVTVMLPVTPGNDVDIELEEEQEKEVKPKRVDVFGEYAGDDLELKAVLKDFEAMRKQKSPMTERAKRLLCAELDRLHQQGHDRVECLNTAILNGWKSVYAPKPSIRRIEPIPEYKPTTPKKELSQQEIEELKNRISKFGGKVK